MRDQRKLKELLISTMDAEREAVTSQFFNIMKSKGEVRYNDIVDQSDVSKLEMEKVSQLRQIEKEFRSEKVQSCQNPIGPYCVEFKFQEDFDKHVKHWHRRVIGLSQPIK